MKKIAQRLLDLLFPPRCVFCRVLLLEKENMVCSHCVRHLPYTTADRYLEKGMLCVSPLRYDGAVRESIHRFKFGGRSFYARAYAPLMAQEVAKLHDGAWDLITWVPLAKRRKRQRGYDQAFLLAQELGNLLDCPSVPCLRKIRNTKAQSSISDPKERRENAKGVYALLDGVDLAGKKILLVDDVVTSGATLNSCRKVLLSGGADRVIGVTVASAAKEE